MVFWQGGTIIISDFYSVRPSRWAVVALRGEVFSNHDRAINELRN